jgi:Ser/Thr protein kinase RdoA (MazF antagonist)
MSPRPAVAAVDTRVALTAACRQAGLPTRGRLLRHYSNAVYLLDEAPVVAKVAWLPGALRRARTAVAIAGALAGAGFPATAPASLPTAAAPQPITLTWQGHQVAVTFWCHYRQPAGRPPPGSRALASIAAQLHRLAAPPVDLPAYQPLTELEATLADPTHPAVDQAQRDWLLSTITRLRRAYRPLDPPLGRGLIHADLVGGNLLWDSAAGPAGVVLADWDTACIGPREVDLLATCHQPRYGTPRACVEEFTDQYGHDPAGWPGYPTLFQIRELSTLTPLIHHAATNPASAAELQHRLATLTGGDGHTPWNPQ